MSDVLCTLDDWLGRYLQLGLHTAVLLNVILYLLPLWGAEFQADCFYRVLKLGIAIAVFNLIKTHGRPQFSKEYGLRLVQDEQAHSIMYFMIFMSGKPFFRTSTSTVPPTTQLWFSSVSFVSSLAVALLMPTVRSALVLGKYLKKNGGVIYRIPRLGGYMDRLVAAESEALNFTAQMEGASRH